jgi:hypothetical protein
MKYGAWAAVCAMLVLTACGVEPKPPADKRIQHERSEQRMSIIKWVSTDGDGSNAASWQGGALPGDGDIALLDGTSQVSWTAGLTLAHGAILRTSESFLGDIGLPGSYLVMDGNSGADAHEIQAVARHPGKLFLFLDDGAAAEASKTQVVIDKPDSATGNCHLDGNFVELVISGGGVTLDASLTIGEICRFYDGRIYITDGAGLPLPAQFGGLVECHTGTAPQVYGGTWIQRKAWAVWSSVAMRGGHIVYDPVSPVAADIAYDLQAGSLDVRGNAADLFAGLTSTVYIGKNFDLQGIRTIDTTGTRIDYRSDFPTVE